MRPEIVPAPGDRSSLAGAPVHVLVRDFPEVLPVLWQRGVNVAGMGARPLVEAGEEVVEAVARAVAWRKSG